MIYKVIILLLSIQTAFSVEKIRINIGTDKNDRRYEFHKYALKMILEKTKSKFGSYQIEDVYIENQAKMRQSLVLNKIDVGILPNQLSEENQLIRYVPYPIRMGLLGYRVLVIRRKDAKKFANIKSIDELKQYKMGFVRSWEDLQIYKENGLNIRTVDNYKELFQGLEDGQYDYVPRSLPEAIPEYLSINKKKSLAIDSHLLFYYPFADFFYLRRSDTKLYERIILGFEEMIADGSWVKILKQKYKKDFSVLKLDRRTYVEMLNPFISTNITNNLKFWIDHDRLLKIF